MLPRKKMLFIKFSSAKRQQHKNFPKSTSSTHHALQPASKGKMVDNAPTEDVPLHTLLSIYGLDLPRTIPSTDHPSSFVHNPFWIKNMSDAKWLKMPERKLITKGDERYESEILQLRKPGEYSGLMNRGNICYANSSLQAWFHNPIIRRGILSAEIDPKKDTDGIFRHLQNLFGHMKFSKFREADPKRLYCTLNINNADQHDAQEFAMRLSEKLSELDDNIKRIFDENILGQLKYIRKCVKCGSMAENLEQYSIVDLTPQDTLQQALGEKLSPEILEGYHCDHCKTASGAERTLEFVTFPPVLQFQINRYKYNTRTHSNTKITRSFVYPDECDFQPYILAEPNSDHTYAAFAALIHYGTSADHGHYVMKIRNQKTGVWHLFSDTNLDESDPVENGMNESDNVYMVMYIKKSVLESFSPDDITICGESTPEINLKEMVDEEDKMRLTLREEQHANFLVRHALVMEMVTGSKESCILKFHFFSNKWVRDLLRSVDSQPDVIPVENLDLLCRHNKVALPKWKSNNVPYRSLPPGISAKILDQLGGGPRLVVEEMLCQECAKAYLKRHPDALTANGNVNPCPSTPEPMDVENVTIFRPMDEECFPPQSNTTSEPSFSISCRLARSPFDSKCLKPGEVTVDKTKTVQQLKFLVGKMINTNPTEFTLHFNGTKLSDDDMTLSQCGIGPQDSIHISLL